MRRTLIFAGIGLAVIVASYIWEWLRSRRTLSPAELMERLERLPSFREAVNRLQNLNHWDVQIALSDAPPLTAERLASMASAAFGRSFLVRAGDLDALDAACLPNEGDALVAGSGPHYYVAIAPYLFEVLDLATGGGRLQTFRYTGSAVHLEELENGFLWTGKLAAQAIAGSSVSVTMNGTSFQRVDATRAIAALCSDEPLTALSDAAAA